MTEKPTFSDVGKEFDTYEQFLEAFHDFCQTNYQPFIVTTNNKRQIILHCRHGYKRASTSTGTRTKLRYNYLGCNAKITCYKPTSSNRVKITSVNLEHNHEVSKAAFDTVELTEKEKEVVVDLHEGNCKVSQICRVLKNKFDKNLSSQKLRNMIRKLSPNDDDHTLRLQTFLERVEEEGGTVNHAIDDDGNVSVLFLSSHVMMKAFRESACRTVQVDTSFDIEASKYKLCGFCYLNPSTNRSEFCALAFISYETAENLKVTFQFFKRICLQPPTVIIVDKDFNEITVLMEIFPEAHILLCIFHVIKYMKTLVATALVTVELKENIMALFKAVMYARSKDIYEQKKNDFLLAADGVQVRVNKKYVLLTEQFLNNWHTCKEMWVTYYRKDLPTYGDNTNNRIERSFWTLKQSLRDRFSTLPVIQEAVIHLISLCDERITQTSSTASLKSLIIYDPDSCINTLNRKAALVLNERGCVLFHGSLKALQKRRQHMIVEDDCVREKYEEGESTYQCSQSTCTCTYFCQNQAPCRHILLKREHETGSLSAIFSVSLFHARYHRKTTSTCPATSSVEVELPTQSEDLPETNVSLDDTTASLTSREKYNKILPVMLNIASLTTNHGTSQFMKYLQAMNKVEMLVRDGADLTFAFPEVSKHEDQLQEVEEGDSELSPTPAPNNVHCNTPSTFAHLQFRAKVKARGRPKRVQRQLCSFNRTSADAAPPTGTSRGRKRKLKVSKVTTSKRRCQSVSAEANSDYCPVCSRPVLSGENGVTYTDCCSTLIHGECLNEVDHCPDCVA